MSTRLGEAEKNWFRCGRYSHVNNEWFFMTREMTQEGPFSSKLDAKLGLLLYVNHVTH